MPKNHYQDERIQKKLPKSEDEQLQYTGMKINKHMLICGGTGTGKTNCLYDYLIQTSQPKKGTFKHIYLCYKTDETLYEDLFEQLDDGITGYRSVEEFPSVNDFPDATSYKKNEIAPKFLVVFDDCVNEKDKNNIKKIKAYFTYGRKKNITLCFLAQSYYMTDKFIREQITYLLLLSLKNKYDLNSVTSQCATLGIEKEQVKAMFETATTPRGPDDLPFLKITMEKCAKDKQFSRDWLEYLNPDDFKYVISKRSSIKESDSDSDEEILK